MEYTLFYDTNALLNILDKAFLEHFVISQKTLEEVERIKTSSRKDGEVKYKARKLAALLDKHCDFYDVVPITNDIFAIIDELQIEATTDSIILACALKMNKTTPILVVSDDINVKFISQKIFGLRTKGIDDLRIVENEEYTGYKEITMTDTQMSYFYEHCNENIYDLCINEYLVIKKENGEIVDNRRWDGFTHRAMTYKQINNDFFGKVKPRNNNQILAFDMLQNKDITIKILSGKWGSGKTYIMVCNILQMIQQGKYDKLVFIRNPVTLADVPEIGALPGSLEEKIAPYSAVLADCLGGQQGLEFQMMQGRIEIVHLGFVRGRTFANACVLVDESANLTKDQVQLLISRMGENSALFLDGEYKQVDSPVFRLNNGLMAAINCLKGNEMVGFVKLNKTERSKTAELADLLD